MSWVIIIFALVLAVIYFLPTITIPLVSISISALELTQGLEIMGRTLAEGNALFALELVLPILIVLIWLVAKGKKRAKLSIIIAVLYLAGMILSVDKVKRIALNAVDPSKTFWFYLACLLAVVIIIIDVLVIMGKIGDQADVSEVIAGTASAVSQATAAVSAAAERKSVTLPKRERKCAKCGNLLDDESDFCTYCGTKYNEPIKRKCQNCNMLIDEDDDFCPFCGAKYEEQRKKTCQACGKELTENEEFCPFCGAKYVDPNSRICKVCGSMIRPEADFCGKCGTKYEN